ncbi:DHA2 family efflux MFS transporter permease subunit [Streptomyces erythrochromogenes]|uniref:DHA2 family efflux MFS transporter permease subunit n=1 Tax=Streptomyces erythrochromogenes TaxID=285574 RepID=UPI0036BB2966
MHHLSRRLCSGGSAGSPQAALYALCVSFFMICLDATIVNVAVPGIRASLDASLNEAVWVNSAYALCYAVPLILAGRLGDRYGPKRVFLVGLAGFSLASLACALAPVAAVLIAARAVQGLTAALIAPQTMSLIVHLFPVEHRGRALGVWGAVGGAAMAAGPVLGGLLVAWVGWPGIFLVNLPVGAMGWIAASKLVPDWRPEKKHRLDLGGIVLSGLGLTAVVFGVQSGEAYGWGTVSGPITISRILGIGVVCLAAFVWWQHVNPNEPLLPLRLFHCRDFSAAASAGASMGAAMGGLFLPLMLYLQNELGHSALVAGALTVPMFVLSSLCSRRAGKQSDTTSPRLIAALGFLALIGGITSLVWLLSPGVTLGALTPPLLLSGIGIGLVSAPLAGIATRGLEPALVGSASGVFNTTRQLGGALGSAATGVLLQAHLGATATTATQAALIFPVVALSAGLACCGLVQPRQAAHEH